MKLGRVRVGERFVYDHVGGVYAKVTHDLARCIYGSAFGKEMPVDPNLSVFVIFQRDRFPDRKDEQMPEPGIQGPPPGAQEPVSVVQEPPQREIVEGPAREGLVVEQGLTGAVAQPEQTELPTTGMSIVFVDDDNDEAVLETVPDATAAQIAAYSGAESVKLDEKSAVRRILETYVDHKKRTVYVLVGSEV